MPDVSASRYDRQPHPLDLVEEIANANEWAFDRTNDDELVAQLVGKWGDYRLYFGWSPDMSALQFSCGLDLRVPKYRRNAVNELLALVNEQLWLGHFDLWHSRKRSPMYRHTVLLRGARGGAGRAARRPCSTSRVNECERYYQAFQFVIWGGKTPERGARGGPASRRTARPSTSRCMAKSARAAAARRRRQDGRRHAGRLAASAASMPTASRSRAVHRRRRPRERCRGRRRRRASHADAGAGRAGRPGASCLRGKAAGHVRRAAGLPPLRRAATR